MTIHQPWHRRPDESAKAFYAFMLYRDMPPKARSLEKVRQMLSKKPSYKRHLQRWSSLHDWVRRALANDEHLAAVKAEAQEQAIKEMAERQAKEGMLAQAKGIERYTKLGPEEMSPELALRSMVDGAKLERTARGEPTEIVKEDRTVRLAELTDEELAEIIRREKAEEE